ncbi:MAG: hypothetical protein DCF22_22620 [Leptolyngbya sp.]|nr:MAG: hypothetical protein DCF22_22620 [Leptolyngbya sp.]
MVEREIEERVQVKYEQLAPYLNETSKRIWAAVEALSLGHGGVTSVFRATGLSRTTIHAGINELEHSQTEAFAVEDYGAVRRKGGGRKPVTQSDPTVLEDLEPIRKMLGAYDRQSNKRQSEGNVINLLFCPK